MKKEKNKDKEKDKDKEKKKKEKKKKKTVNLISYPPKEFMTNPECEREFFEKRGFVVRLLYYPDHFYGLLMDEITNRKRDRDAMIINKEIYEYDKKIILSVVAIIAESIKFYRSLPSTTSDVNANVSNILDGVEKMMLKNLLIFRLFILWTIWKNESFASAIKKLYPSESIDFLKSIMNSIFFDKSGKGFTFMMMYNEKNSYMLSSSTLDQITFKFVYRLPVGGVLPDKKMEMSGKEYTEYLQKIYNKIKS